MKRLLLGLVSLAVLAITAAPVHAAATIVVVKEPDVTRQVEGSVPTDNWVLYRRIPTSPPTPPPPPPPTPPSAAQFVSGPSTPPGGTGSLQFNTALSSDKAFLYNYDHIGTPLSSINQIGYSTYRTAGNLQQVTSINIEIDSNGGTFSNAPGEYAVLVFEPVYNTVQGTVTNGTWQTWDAYRSGTAVWWSSRDLRDASNNLVACNPNGITPGCAGKYFVPWSTIVAGLPSATILGGFGVNQGSGNPGLVSAADMLTLGYGGNSITYNFEPFIDSDNDTIEDASDNCPTVANTNQANNDGDGQGDACDPDDDNDGVADTTDNCQFVSNPSQANNDGDLQGDACDPDDDNDGVVDGTDNCALTANPSQTNTDGDLQGDACDPDDDNDGVADGPDNCDLVANPSQADFDGDTIGDACDTPNGPPVDADQCKNGGWLLWAPRFKNQGDCVSYVQTGGRNGPAGP